MASNYKQPPRFDEHLSFETWKNEIEIWRRVTDLPKEKQALAVSLSLSGRAREIAMEIAADDLAAEDGMSVLIIKLDSIFLKEKKDSAYEAYSKFDSFKKTEEQSMTDYIIEFEQLYNKARKYEMTLPDAVLAFKLLDSAVLSLKERQLALSATSELNFASMKSGLKRIFGDSKKVDSIQIKTEDAFFTSKFDRNVTKQQQHRTFNRAPQKGTNPLNRFGKRTRCAICESVYHWVKDCPNKHEQTPNSVNMNESEPEKDSTDTCNITLFAKEKNSAYEIFVAEARCSAIIDTACTRTVCGAKWLNDYMKETNQSESNSIPSNKSFKFGDGNIIPSLKQVTITAKIGNTKCNIKTEVVASDIPLLLSKESLKRAGTVLNLENDTASMFNEPIELEFTSSGHYCINIVNDYHDKTGISTETVLISTDLTKQNKHEQKKSLLKLHKQFGHASADRLKKLIKSAGKEHADFPGLLQEIVDTCETCLMFKKPSPKPAVGFPLATEYNETVALDLHELEHNVWYLHMIDQFTRFSAACIVRSKVSTEIVTKFIQFWICVHGAPRKVLTDNGGEFNNMEFHDMAENFNIEVKTTAAYSPWSNGLLERHNQTLTQILLKVKYDNKSDWETALAWALMAKNALNNEQGFSSYQLVYGQSPNLPTVLCDKLPALEGTTRSAMVGKHVSALHAARQAFAESESSERIRRALRKQVRPSGEKYFHGDKVYYKRSDKPEWKGPGIVIGQDGVVVFIRHGGLCVRVHQSRLRKVNEPFVIETKPENETISEQTIKDIDQSGDCVLSDSDCENSLSESENQQQQILPQANENFKIQRGDKVQFKYRNSEMVHKATILSRAGKATGKNKTWFNLQYTEPSDKAGVKESVDLDKVLNFEKITIDSEAESDMSEESVLEVSDVNFADAKSAELNNWINNAVYVTIPDNNQKCISTRWICSLKNTPEGIVPKARLVARGFEETNNDDIPKDSPTCSTESLHMILALFALNQWTPMCMDIKTAFLQGSKLSRDIYIRPPVEAHVTGVIWKLQKCVYGLVDASLYWYNTVCEVMKNCDAVISSLDPAVFFWTDKNGQVTGILASHVDDFILGGNKDFVSCVLPGIRAAFCVGKEEIGIFRYVGIVLSKTCNGEILLHQKQYVKNLEPISIEWSKKVDHTLPLTTKELDRYRSKVGQILWLARQSRPDISFEASVLCGSVKNATVQTVFDVNKVIRKLKCEEVVLKFQQLGACDQLELVVFSDSSLGNLEDGGSQGGHFIVLMGEGGKFSPLHWQSKRIRRVVRSTLAGETLAMADGLDNSIFLSSLFSELTTGNPNAALLKITCVTDCHSLFDAVRSTKLVLEKRLRMEISAIKELLENKQVKRVLWSSTKKQLADCFTKRGASVSLLLKAINDGVWHIQDK